MKLNTVKLGKQSRVQFAAVLLCGVTMLNAGAAAAGGFKQVKPFEYSTGKSESLTSLYAHWSPLQEHQHSSSEILMNNPFMPSLVSHLQANRGRSVPVNSFSKLDSTGYYIRSSLKDEEPSKLEQGFYTLLGVGLLGGSMYLQAREIQYDFEVLRK